MVAAALAATLVAGLTAAYRTRPSEAAWLLSRAFGARIVPAAVHTGMPDLPGLDRRSDRGRLLAAAYALRGKPYVWGAKGPDAYDCSGFTKAAYAAVGVRLPDGSFNQAEGEKPVAHLSVLRPGDLLFYRWSGRGRVAHVTMYVGEGMAIGTGSPGQLGEVGVYPLASDFSYAPALALTYRHITLPDER